MATTKTRIACPLCGIASRPTQFGISDDGVTFEVPGHPFEVRAYHFQGRARITVQRLPLSLECARALLKALAHAHNKLEQEIEAATGGGEYPDLGLGV